MSGEQLGQAHVRADIARQQARYDHLTTDDIVASYAPEIAALSRPPRTANSPD